MEKVRNFKTVHVLVILAVGLMLTGKSSAGFEECYAKCFVACMINPFNTICSCTTGCLKDCIFRKFQNDVREQESDGLDYCKLGCAISMCSNFSTSHAPNGEKVDGCGGSCSNKCVKSYSLPESST